MPFLNLHIFTAKWEKREHLFFLPTSVYSKTVGGLENPGLHLDPFVHQPLRLCVALATSGVWGEGERMGS